MMLLPYITQDPLSASSIELHGINVHQLPCLQVVRACGNASAAALNKQRDDILQDYEPHE